MSGVYKIVNNVNGKFYIGSTTRKISKRWQEHLNKLRKGTHSNCHLQRSYDKYGEKSFDVETLIECSPSDVLIHEQKYINELTPDYNICKTAGNTYGIKLSDDVRKKMSESRRGKNNPFYGKQHTKEVMDDLIKQQKERGQWKGTDNPKFGKGHEITGKNNPSYKGDFIFKHPIYGTEICHQQFLIKKYNLCGSAISNICNGKRNKHNGWICLGKSDGLDLG
jgi:group I intron endonuclease